jgi:hypothetical protein
MRQLHARWRRADPLVVGKEVEVKHPGGISLPALSTEIRFYGMKQKRSSVGPFIVSTLMTPLT